MHSYTDSVQFCLRHQLKYFLLYLKNNENVRKTSVSMPVEKMLKAKNVQKKDSIKQAFTSAGSK